MATARHWLACSNSKHVQMISKFEIDYDVSHSTVTRIGIADSRNSGADEVAEKYCKAVQVEIQQNVDAGVEGLTRAGIPVGTLCMTRSGKLTERPTKRQRVRWVYHMIFTLFARESIMAHLLGFKWRTNRVPLEEEAVKLLEA